MRVVGGDRPNAPWRSRVSARSHSPIASRASIQFAGSTVCVRSVRPHCREPFLSEPRRLARPAEHRQHVGERDVGAVQSPGVADRLGELQGVPELREALVAAAEVREVAAERRERPDLGLLRADRARELERLLADRERLLVAPEQRNPGASAASARARSGEGGLRGHELDRALERGEEGVAAAALEQVAASRSCRSAACSRSLLADELDRSPRELHRARRGACLAGELRGPGAELVEAEPRELGCVGHGVPQRERALEVRARLGQAEDRLRLARSRDRGDSASAVRPAAAQCGASSAGAAAPLRASSSASRACTSSRSPGRIVA